MNPINKMSINKNNDVLKNLQNIENKIENFEQMSKQNSSNLKIILENQTHLSSLYDKLLNNIKNIIKTLDIFKLDQPKQIQTIPTSKNNIKSEELELLQNKVEKLEKEFKEIKNLIVNNNANNKDMFNEIIKAIKG